MRATDHSYKCFVTMQRDRMLLRFRGRVRVRVLFTFLSGDADEDPVRFFSFWGCEGWEYSRPPRNSTTFFTSSPSAADSDVDTWDDDTRASQGLFTITLVFYFFLIANHDYTFRREQTLIYIHGIHILIDTSRP